MTRGTGLRQHTALLATILAASLFAAPAWAISKCGSGKRITCVVDGDTIWLDGEKIRLQGYETPETATNICGGQSDIRLGNAATSRLIEILNTANLTIQRTGKDRYGRTLAIIRADGRNVGDILIAEGLARRWPDGREFWCN